MKVLFLALIAILVSPAPAFALSCAVRPGMEDAIPKNELIVRAKVIDIKTAMHIPYIQSDEMQDQLVTFEVLDVYRGPDDAPRTFVASFSHFFRTWGPQLKEGDEGEYLFDKDAKGWVFAGPGGCNFVSEKAWVELRAHKKTAP